MAEPPTTRYATGPRGALAFQTTGVGPPDLLMVPGMHSHLDLQWQLPGYRRFVRGLSQHCRLIRYDKLGTGLSDPTPAPPTPQERVDDLEAIAAVCGAELPVLFGYSEGGPVAIRFAAGHLVCGLVLYGTAVRPPPPEQRVELDVVFAQWGTGRSLDTFAPSQAENPEARRIAALIERSAASPAMAGHLLAALTDGEAEGLLEQIRVPALVLHRDRDFVPVGEARFIAARLPRATLRIIPGTDHQPWAGDVDAVVEQIIGFLSSLNQARPSARPGAPRVARSLTGWGSLTVAERRVAELAANGYTNVQIAEALFLSRGTVETHLKRIYHKLAIEGRHQLDLVRRSSSEPGS